MRSPTAFMGMHGHYFCNMAADHADVVMGVGMRFDDRAMGRFKDFNPQAQIIHLDIDPAEIGKNFHTHAPVLGDVRQSLRALLPHLTSTTRPDWIRWIDDVKAQHPTGTTTPRAPRSPAPGSVAPSRSRRSAMPPSSPASASTKCGPPSTTATLVPRQYISSGGLGTMGFEVPAALGAQFAQDEPVWSILRRRRLPDDLPGAPDRRRAQASDPLRHLQQRLPRHGPAVAGAVLRG